MKWDCIDVHSSTHQSHYAAVERSMSRAEEDNRANFVALKSTISSIEGDILARLQVIKAVRAHMRDHAGRVPVPM